MPSAFVRMTPETAPNWIQRASSSASSFGPESVKKPPMSEPQVLMPERPMFSAWVTEEASPSKRQLVDGSPPQVICE